MDEYEANRELVPIQWWRVVCLQHNHLLHAREHNAENAFAWNGLRMASLVSPLIATPLLT
jgi:hypothetical protein